MTQTRGTATPTTRIRPTTLTLALAAGALLLSAGGGAVAGTMVTGAQIKDNTVASADVRNKSLRTKDLAPATVTQLKGRTGAPGAPGRPGVARAYAYVHDTEVTKQSGGITVAHEGTGFYCVTVPGVSSADRVAMLSLNFSTSASQPVTNGSQAMVETSDSCVAPAFGVVTLRRTFPDADTTELAPYDQDFNIVIP
ncbi:hypothetical protein [Nocardioides sp. 503]|uniref:hypothetical protein n=1 Tax=Nocardioides sp. 503 TaxID=2508326 RepID=UPI00106F6CF4|nr:hypothetical protein [Nocardioides sp. 503]